MAEVGKIVVDVDDAKYIRDQFALAVLPGMYERAPEQTDLAEIAEQAYGMADAMMKARERTS